MHKRKKKKRDPFSSNAVRLSNKELVVTAIFIIIVVLFLAPYIWFKMEKIDTSGQFRLASKHRANYWLYRHWVADATKNHPVIFLGDSVVWGMYVNNDNTIPAKINQALGKKTVANLAIDGLHSIATKGLLENYASAIRDKKVIVHYNPLWMQSKITDLSHIAVINDEEDRDMDRAPQINHPRLIPQFSQEITAYNEGFSEKAGVLRERYIPFFALLNHIRLSFFNNDDFKQWIIDHPNENPLTKIALTIDACERDKNKNYDRDWETSGMTKQNWPWLEPEESLQWKAFQQIVQLLKKRNNEICIMIGPINPYMLTAESLKRYRALQQEICAWLKSQNVEYVLVKDMPPKMYADASHPLADGYDLIVKQLLKTKILLPKE
ncbi:MAG: hypothetical protein PHS31_04540 [Victivallaceae bacterium]|nr:hypothetical protein [Victivallaceae bacterium]MDD4199637.1 hypothetical protein [Paludibacter sp.]MDD4429336.1 hypothetical protein [Paludibacter sp.]